MTKFKCLLCKTKITDEEFQFEDYFTVYRGFNAHTYKAEQDSETGFICFSCIKE